MLLVWLNVEAKSVGELLWYIDILPPPKSLLLAPGNKVGVAKLSASPQLGKEFLPPPEQKNTSSDNKDQSTQNKPVPPEEIIAKVPPPPVTMIKQPSPSLFALIIGINEYADSGIADLKGAVPDADAMYEFLTSDLHVPKDQIVNLRNAQATRGAILDAFRALAKDERITSQDPILIFYAGHGGQAKAPSGWQTSDGLVQMLIPHDFAKAGSNKSDDLRGQGVYDFTLSKLLKDIADSKSNNISVIFDSCHSGSGTREDENDPSFAVRSVGDLSEHKLPDTQPDEGERASAIAKGYEQTGLLSHVLMAACMQGQTAKERNARGAFTTELLSILREEGVDKVTYEDVIGRIGDLPLQNPQCEGVHKNRILFNSKVSNPYRALFDIRPSSTPGEFILEGGAANGISVGAEFTVFSDKKLSGKPLGVVKVKAPAIPSEPNPGPFHTKCIGAGTESFRLSGTAYALQTRVGEEQDMRLFVQPDDAFLSLYHQLSEEMKRTDRGKRTFRLVNGEDESPDLSLFTSEEGFVLFRINEPRCTAQGMDYMPFYDIPVWETDRLMGIMRSAADFYYHLRHTNVNRKIDLFKKVSLECLKLEPTDELTDDFQPVLGPAPDAQNLNVGGTITIDVDDDCKYGFRIRNDSQVDFYVALLYFDVGDLSISSYYQPGSAAKGKVDYSLPKGKSMTIGFGNTGTAPYRYFLRDDQSVDVGFLKLYVSSHYVDFSGIPQRSPFTEDRAGMQDPERPPCLWDTLTIPMVQKRGASGDRCWGGPPVHIHIHGNHNNVNFGRWW